MNDLILPPGFHLRENGTVFYETTGNSTSFIRPWNVSEIEDEPRFFMLTPGQRRAIKEADLFFTPKYGKPGWNARKTFPTHNAAAGIAFLMSVGGKLWRFTPRKELVRR